MEIAGYMARPPLAVEGPYRPKRSAADAVVSRLEAENSADARAQALPGRLRGFVIAVGAGLTVYDFAKPYL